MYQITVQVGSSKFAKSEFPLNSKKITEKLNFSYHPCVKLPTYFELTLSEFPLHSKNSWRNSISPVSPVLNYPLNSNSLNLHLSQWPSRILVRGPSGVLTPGRGPEPKICSKLPENYLVLKKSWGQGGLAGELPT